jgi:hypothetical protein
MPGTRSEPAEDCFARLQTITETGTPIFLASHGSRPQLSARHTLKEGEAKNDLLYPGKHEDPGKPADYRSTQFGIENRNFRLFL